MANGKTNKQLQEFHRKMRAYFEEALKPPWIDTGKPNILDEYLDALVPRGGMQPSCLHVRLEDYLSRLAVLDRKILGVRHRKEQWGKVVSAHVAKFQNLEQKWGHLALDALVPNITLQCGLRDVRAENEFEVILYSICGTLSALTRVVAAFLKGSERMHKYSNLQSVLLRHGWYSLAKIVGKASDEWIQDVVCRRNAATHYVALTAASMLGYVQHDNDSRVKYSIAVAITKKALNYVPVWLDDVPVIGGTSTLSTEASDGSLTIKDIYDKNNHLILQRSGEPLEVPEMIDGVEYVDAVVRNLEDYTRNVLQELQIRAGWISH